MHSALVGIGLGAAIGVQTGVASQSPGETPAESATRRAAFLTAPGGRASNPLTIASGAAVFAAASTAGAERTTPEAILLVAGVTIDGFAATAGPLTSVSRGALDSGSGRAARMIYHGGYAFKASREHATKSSKASMYE
jgi:threonine/homoserine/homoserine lactone efflux protein